MVVNTVEIKVPMRVVSDILIISKVQINKQSIERIDASK